MPTDPFGSLKGYDGSAQGVALGNGLHETHVALKGRDKRKIPSMAGHDPAPPDLHLDASYLALSVLSRWQRRPVFPGVARG
jgi:hypothetical protein